LKIGENEAVDVVVVNFLVVVVTFDSLDDIDAVPHRQLRFRFALYRCSQIFQIW
jgi:hypothetical protein